MVVHFPIVPALPPAGHPEQSKSSIGAEALKPARGKWVRWSVRFVRFALFLLAIVSLRRQLGDIGFRDLRANLQSHGWVNIALSLGLTGASFLAMGSFDVIGLRSLRTAAARKIPAAFSMATAMVANAFSQSVGVAFLTGGAIRMRAYSRFGLGKADVVRLTSFVTITAIVGLMVTGAVVFLTSSGVTRIARFEVRLATIGALVALPLLLYVCWLLSKPGKRYGKGKWSFNVPDRATIAQQLGMSSLDWILAATVLFFLMPPSISLAYRTFLPAFFVAQTIATLSHVPGGAGVFETLLVGLLAHSAPAKIAILASLLIYRLFYYLIPLLGAVAVAAVYELKTAGRSPTPMPSSPLVEDGSS